jgi:hypothetical protein
VTTFLPYVGAANRLFSPVGFQLIDDFTGEQPLGGLRASLEASDGGGGWIPVGTPPVITSLGVLAYPGLGRIALVSGQPPTPHRVRIDAELYRPFYRATSPDGVVFPVPAWSQTEPPGGITPTFAQMILLPAFHYQFPSYVAVLRGEVVDQITQQPVADALVTEPITGERTLTDERGCFSLPLRKLQATVPTALTIHVSDSGGGAATLPVTVPHDLAHGQIIPI